MNRPAISVASTSKPARWTVIHLILIALLTHLTESTVDRWSTESIDILGELAPVRLNLTGVEIAPGPYSISPALYFTGEERSIRLLETSYDKVMTLLQSNHHDITFVAAVRQEPFNVGTLFSLSEGFTRFLELQSSGRKDEIRLHYTHLGVPRVETFNYRLADGVWHRLAISVSGGIASLYVDCKRIERRLMTGAPDTDLPVSEQQQRDGQLGSKMSLWIGQRGDQHFLFKGAMQDVRLVAGSNGHLTQCPTAEAECPTCGEFSSLRSVVARLERSLQQLTNQLEDAEERISQLEQCDCPRSCEANGTVHGDGTTWQAGCQVCSCKKGQVSCGPVQCPATPCRNPILAEGECCPKCLKKCLYHGTLYEHGDRVSPRLCIECECKNASMQCKQLDPATHCPALSCPPSEHFTIAGECCPQCPGVDYCGAGHNCHARAQCINLQTTFACHCLPGFTGDGKHCTDIDECETDGGPDGHRCGANAICINTPGSYRCECPSGYIHPAGPPMDNYTCIELDECSEGLHNCHPSRASCINTPGSYQCGCKEGYTGDGINCEPVCEQPCQNGGLCVAPGRCSCRRGFHGSHCELDVDECASGQDECHPNSVCRNMPGWYLCACKPGFRSLLPDTHRGSLCQDVDECVEGSHSCHGNTQCLNTAGSYECRCPPSNPNCSLACITVEGIHQNGQTWTSHKNPCISCQCREGVATCSRLPCPASCSTGNIRSSSNRNATDPSCCPQCRNSSVEGSSRNSQNHQCRHQELPNVTFNSGQRWIYKCQSCECLHGETDCWQMECPPVYCSQPVHLPGDCCPRCPDNDPCSADSLVIDEHSLPEGRGCHYQGLNYTQGAEWAAGLDGCTTCKCKEPFCQHLLGRLSNSADSHANHRTERFAVSWILAVLSCVWWAMSSGSPAAHLFGSGVKPTTTRETSRHGHRRRKMNTRIYPEEVLD